MKTKNRRRKKEADLDQLGAGALLDDAGQLRAVAVVRQIPKVEFCLLSRSGSIGGFLQRLCLCFPCFFRCCLLLLLLLLDGRGGGLVLRHRCQGPRKPEALRIAEVSYGEEVLWAAGAKGEGEGKAEEDSVGGGELGGECSWGDGGGEARAD